MTTLDSLLAAILDPATDCDAVRLVMADALEEAGQDERAELIRVQIRIDRLNTELMNEEDYGNPNCKGCRERLVLLVCEQELIRSQRGAWLTRYPWVDIASLRHGAVQDGRAFLFDRGFVEEIHCPAADWLSHADTLTAAHPIRCVTLTTMPELAHGRGHRADDMFVWLEGCRKAIMAERSLTERETIQRLLFHEWHPIAFTLPAG